MGDNIWLPDRNGVRTPMQWTSGENAGFSTALAQQLYEPVIQDETFGSTLVNVASQLTVSDSLFHSIQRMITLRKSSQVFGWGNFTWVDVGASSIAAYLRLFKDQTWLVLNNLSDTPQIALSSKALSCTYKNVFTGNYFEFTQPITLQPYQYLWLLKQD
jgi:maltose alpha-D-glucosyltransferase/alpha-amylase